MRWLAAVLWLSTAATAQANLDDTFGRDVLTLVASDYACHRFDVYLAETNEQRQQGLMHVRELPATTGMWFVYNTERRASIWMKNTYIPLDVIFVRADGQVSSVFHNAEPLSLKSMAATEPVQYVLEINGGLAEALHIDADSYVVWSPRPGAEQ